MDVPAELNFDQLVGLVKKLPMSQWIRLKQEVELEQKVTEGQTEMEKLLLSAPTFSRKQIRAIEKTRKAIDQWRVK